MKKRYKAQYKKWYTDLIRFGEQFAPVRTLLVEKMRLKDYQCHKKIVKWNGIQKKHRKCIKHAGRYTISGKSKVWVHTKSGGYKQVMKKFWWNYSKVEDKYGRFDQPHEDSKWQITVSNFQRMHESEDTRLQKYRTLGKFLMAGGTLKGGQLRKAIKFCRKKARKSSQDWHYDLKSVEWLHAQMVHCWRQWFNFHASEDATFLETIQRYSDQGHRFVLPLLHTFTTFIHYTLPKRPHSSHLICILKLLSLIYFKQVAALQEKIEKMKKMQSRGAASSVADGWS